MENVQPTGEKTQAKNVAAAAGATPKQLPAQVEKPIVCCESLFDNALLARFTEEQVRTFLDMFVVEPWHATYLYKAAMKLPAEREERAQTIITHLFKKKDLMGVLARTKSGVECIHKQLEQATANPNGHTLCGHVALAALTAAMKDVNVEDAKEEKRD